MELHTQLPSSHSEQQLYDACSYTPPNPERNSWEVRRTDVTIVKVIGKGAFCQVAKAEARNLNGSKGVTTVAAKMLKGEQFMGITPLSFQRTKKWICTNFFQRKYDANLCKLRNKSEQR